MKRTVIASLVGMAVLALSVLSTNEAHAWADTETFYKGDWKIVKKIRVNSHTGWKRVKIIRTNMVTGRKVIVNKRIDPFGHKHVTKRVVRTGWGHSRHARHHGGDWRRGRHGNGHGNWRRIHKGGGWYGHARWALDTARHFGL